MSPASDWIVYLQRQIYSQESRSHLF